MPKYDCHSTKCSTVTILTYVRKKFCIAMIDRLIEIQDSYECCKGESNTFHSCMRKTGLHSLMFIYLSFASCCIAFEMQQRNETSCRGWWISQWESCETLSHCLAKLGRHAHLQQIGSATMEFCSKVVISFFYVETHSIMLFHDYRSPFITQFMKKYVKNDDIYICCNCCIFA